MSTQRKFNVPKNGAGRRVTNKSKSPATSPPQKKETIHMEHCSGCIDPLCRPISEAKVSSLKRNITCAKCLKLLKD